MTRSKDLLSAIAAKEARCLELKDGEHINRIFSVYTRLTITRIFYPQNSQKRKPS